MIGDTETALLEAVKGLFGNTLRDVDTHPGTWDDVAIKRMLLSEPAVYLAWLGCGPGRTSREVESHWVFYVCASMLVSTRLLSAWWRGLTGRHSALPPA